MQRTDYEEWISDAASATDAESARTALLRVIAFMLVDVICELRERDHD